MWQLWGFKLLHFSQPTKLATVARSVVGYYRSDRADTVWDSPKFWGCCGRPFDLHFVTVICNVLITGVDPFHNAFKFR